LAQRFVDKYIEVSKDSQLTKLLQFYKCYRAYVRGKVVSFRLDDKNIPNKEKENATKEAQSYFKLASKYAENL
jgi:aminoglycoside phosphotransferase family enzyme